MKQQQDNIVAFDSVAVRKDFPVLAREVYGKKLAFLDSAASAQKPQCVIDAERQCYEEEYANIHRGVYWLSQQATKRFEAARKKVQAFINAKQDREIIFVRGGTEAINLVAHSYGKGFLKAGDEIIISEMEHHANIVPWQMLREEKGIVLKVIPFNEAGELDIDAYKELLSDKTKFVAVTHVSNALGTVNPVKEMAKLAHAVGAKILVDGCQAVPHLKVDVQDIDADFYAFSGHKLYGPTGIGVLYGKAELLQAMPPYQTGGEMIRTVTFDKTEYNVIPHKFEAGTPAIAQAIGLGAAIDYLSAFDMDDVRAHDDELVAYASAELQKIKGMRLIGTAKEKVGVVSFVLDGIHPHDIGTILDREGVAVRAGHHCAQPIMQHYQVSATVRASFGIYNNKADVDALVKALQKCQEIFG